MSHRWDCPTDWEARREGERAQENGRSRSSNPYDDRYWNRDRACPDAADEWARGYRRAEIREEEQREEEASRQRYECEQQSDTEYVRSMCESNRHERHDEAGDRFGPRCYCGLVRWTLESAPVDDNLPF